jgi:hypothetical protein
MEWTPTDIIFNISRGHGTGVVNAAPCFQNRAIAFASSRRPPVLKHLVESMQAAAGQFRESTMFLFAFCGCLFCRSR